MFVGGAACWKFCGRRHGLLWKFWYMETAAIALLVIAVGAGLAVIWNAVKEALIK
jgi:hypothetical protein